MCGQAPRAGSQEWPRARRWSLPLGPARAAHLPAASRYSPLVRTRDPVTAALAKAGEGPAPLVPLGASLLCACSGGADSVALAVALVETARARPAFGWTIALGHVDHRLRPSSADEAAQVQALAAALGVPFLLERLEPAALSVEIAAAGVEAAARRLRYFALERLAHAAGASLVATAHTRTDQAETTLLRLSRGGGLGALAGVRALRPLGERGVRLVRPLLDVGRAGTAAFCAARGLLPVDDAHNHDPRHPRVRLREGFARLDGLLGPGLEKALGRAARIAAEEEALLAALAGEALCAVTATDGKLRAAEVAALPVALQRRVLLRAASAAGTRPELVHLEALLALLLRARAALSLPGGAASLRCGLLSFQAQAIAQAPVLPDLLPEVAVTGPGRYALGTVDLLVDQPIAHAAPPAASAVSLLVELSRAPLPWTLRTLRPGDRFRPAGGRVKKLADLWRDAKIPRDSREGLAVLLDARGGIFFAEGLRPGAAARSPFSSPLRLTLTRECAV